MTSGTSINAASCKKFALIVPTLNEAENMVAVLDRAREALSRVALPWEILVVDDNSTDGTAETVRRYSKSHAGIRLVERRAQQGLAGAITYGWKHTDADLLGVMDADLQHPPEVLPELVAKVCQGSVSYTHLRAHETSLHLVCRLLRDDERGRRLHPDRPHAPHVPEAVSYTHLTLPTICSV